MLKPPIKCEHNPSSVRNFIWVPSVLVMLSMVPIIFFSTSGCSEAPVDPTPEVAVVVATTEPIEVFFDPVYQETQVEQTPLDAMGSSDSDSQPDDSLLRQASDLFEKAKLKSGDSASGASQWVQDKLGDAAQAGGQTADDSWKWATETYESLKSKGLTTAGSTSEWLGQDWHNMESWEYKISTLLGTDEELAVMLNELGKQGWECFNTEERAEGTRFFLKKPSLSYLRSLPFKDFIKLVPLMSNGEK